MLAYSMLAYLTVNKINNMLTATTLFIFHINDSTYSIAPVAASLFFLNITIFIRPLLHGPTTARLTFSCVYYFLRIVMSLYSMTT